MEDHSVTRNLNRSEQDELLLLIAVGRPDFELSRRFLIDRVTISNIRHEITARYRQSFRFLDRFRKEAVSRGYARSEHRRKYLTGLQSSNLWKRQQELEYAVHWLLHNA